MAEDGAADIPLAASRTVSHRESPATCSRATSLVMAAFRVICLNDSFGSNCRLQKGMHRALTLWADLPLVSARSGVINRGWILLIRTWGAAGSY